jgi:rod shape-determining protein MreD
MGEESLQGYWVIVLTLLAAYILAVLPMSGLMAWLRPEWLLMVLVYWIIALPERVGLLTAVAAGLGMDVLEGAALGQNMLALAVVALAAKLLYERIRVFSLVQQASVVFLLVGVHQLITQWVETLEGVGAQTAMFLLPAVTSALLWPPVFIWLRGLRRTFQVR